LWGSSTVEQDAVNVKVVGSNPTPTVMITENYKYKIIESTIASAMFGIGMVVVALIEDSWGEAAIAVGFILVAIYTSLVLHVFKYEDKSENCNMR
jgi:hypothetical protein